MPNDALTPFGRIIIEIIIRHNGEATKPMIQSVLPIRRAPKQLNGILGALTRWGHISAHEGTYRLTEKGRISANK